MARPRTPIGTFGAIRFENGPSGSVFARTRYRDDDGKLGRVGATGRNRAEAERLLKEKLARRASRTGSSGDITADSPFPDLIEAWLDENDVRDLAVNTRELYERDMRTLVLPMFEHFTLREVTVGRVDRFLKSQARISYSRAQHARNALSQALALVYRARSRTVNWRRSSTSCSGRPPGSERRWRSAAAT